MDVMLSEAMLKVAPSKDSAIPIQDRAANSRLPYDARSFPHGPCTRRQIGNHGSINVT
jgi:hypothetical protein